MSILSEHFDDPYHRGECESATHAYEDSLADRVGEQAAGSDESQDCECQIRFELSVDDDDQVLEAWWDGQGCFRCEGTASVLAEAAEGKKLGELHLDSLASKLLDALAEEEPKDVSLCRCQRLVLEVLSKAGRTSLSELDDDLADGTQFGGPSLREEC